MTDIKMQTDKTGIKVRMFGEFEITDGVTGLTEDTIRSDKVTKLLAFLLSRDNMSSTTEELRSTFWPEDDSEKPSGALKNLIYRLRKALSKAWPDRDMILTVSDGYQWNPEIPVSIDYKYMGELAAKSRSETENADEIALLQEAISLYRGKFLEHYSREAWVMVLQTYNHSMYCEAVGRLCDLYEQEGMFQNMEQAALHAIELDPLNESMHCMLMRAYIGGNKQDLAEAHYQEIEKKLYDSFGVRPSQELRNLYDQTMKQTQPEVDSLDVIQKDLKEQMKRTGAFYCEYGVFKKIYDVEERNAGRLGASIFLVLMTMNVRQKAKSYQTDLEVLGLAMMQMQDTVMNCLRKGDIITRLSANQFLVMLEGCNYENAKKVMKRVDDHYKRRKKRVTANILYSYKEMGLDDRGGDR